MIQERIAAIRAELGALEEDELMQYSFLVELSAYVNPHQPELMREEYLHRGCQSRVWLRFRLEKGLFYMDATSDTLLIRGILYIMTELYNGLPPEEIARSEIDFLKDCGISRHFSAARVNGIQSITDSVIDYCRQTSKNAETE